MSATIITFNPRDGVESVTLDGFASSEAIARAVADALAPRYDFHPDRMSVHFEDDGYTVTVYDQLGLGELLTTVTIEWPAAKPETATLTPEQLQANLLLAVENVIAAGQLDWDSGLAIDDIQHRAHAALIEAYQAVTR